MSRNHLPNRRPNQTLKLAFRTQTIHVTCGFDPDTGKVREVFGSADRSTTSDLSMLISDACVVISIALQYGITADELSKSLGSVPEWGPEGMVDVPASVIGVIISAIVDAEKSLTEMTR